MPMSNRSWNRLLPLLTEKTVKGSLAMDELKNQLNALSCELERLYQQLGSGIYDNHGQREIHQRIQEIEHQFRTAIDQELDV